MPRCQCNDPNHFHPGEEEGQWLFPLIDVPKASALNERRAGSSKWVFKPFESRTEIVEAKLLEAEDGELILQVPFTETVRLKSLQVIPFSEDTKPRMVRLFINREDIDFNNIRDIKPLQIVENLPADFEGVIDNPLQASKFGAVDRLIMHISGEEDELLQIGTVGFKGESRGLNKKVVEGIKYEIRAQLKDHASTRADQTGRSDIL